MSAATVMRLVPKKNLPKALSILNGKNAFTTIIAAPLRSYLGSIIIGWRGAFIIGHLLKTRLHSLLILMPFFMMINTLGFILFGHNVIAVFILISFWGLF